MSKGRLTKLEKEYILTNSSMKIDDLADQIGRSRDAVLKVLLAAKPKEVETAPEEQPQKRFQNKFVDRGAGEKYYEENPEMKTPQVVNPTKRDRPGVDLTYKKCVKCKRRFFFDEDINADDTGMKCDGCYARRK